MKKQSFVVMFILLCNLIYAQVSVVTNRNDNKRTGWNQNETQLNINTLNTNQFGLLYKLDVDDQVYAQPLVVSNLEVNGVLHRSVVFVATVNNTVYAFDAEDGSQSGIPLWSTNLTNPYSKPPVVAEIKPEDCGYNVNNPYVYTDFSSKIGIVGTPVIDTTNYTLYVVSRDVDTTQVPCGFAQWINAIDIRTGNLINSVLITAYYVGNGDGSINDTVWFDPLRELQRPGLLMLNNTVLITWAGHCDWNPYHGWILGYDKTTLQQTIKYNDTPDGDRGGIWMSACGPTVDDSDFIYVVSGNGTIGSYDGYSTGDVNWYRNRGESIIKLKMVGDSLQTIDWFTPPKCRLQTMENNDLDYGMSGAFFIPNTDLVLSGSKEGIVYVNHSSNLGGCDTASCSIDSANGVVQYLWPNRNTSVPLLYGTPVYYKYNTSQGDSEFVYLCVRNDSITQYPFNRQIGLLDTTNVKKSYTSRFYPSIFSVSSNGNQSGTGILWASHLKMPRESANSQTYSELAAPVDSNGVLIKHHSGLLEAFDARDVSRVLWSTEMDVSGRDSVGNYAKFNTPTIANGRVYLATFSGTINVYGLFSSVGMEDRHNIIDDFYIYPNPSSEMITIKIKCSSQNKSVECKLYDIYGKLIYQQRIFAEENELDISNLENGIYQVSAIVDGRIIKTEKFVKLQ